MRSYGLVVLGFLSFALSCGNKRSTHFHNSNGKDTCDDPDANVNCCFRDMPDNITDITNISPPNEPGTRLIISGVIYKEDGTTPYPGVLIYAYHTDHQGLYSKKGNETGVRKWHGSLHGWCKTNQEGEYFFTTIRPARYPDNTIPAHIHSAVREPNGKTYYTNDFVFEDDSLVNEKYISSLSPIGGKGIMKIRKDKDGNDWGLRNIILKPE